MKSPTKGPWTVCDSSSREPIYIAAPDRGMVAFVGAVPSPMQTGREPDENEANARLIAAAPSLRKALRSLRDAANNMPTATPAPGGAFTLHNFQISAADVWALDAALRLADEALAEVVATSPVMGSERQT